MKNRTGPITYKIGHVIIVNDQEVVINEENRLNPENLPANLAELTYEELRGKRFFSADLRGADLRDVNLSGTDLRGVDLRHTYLIRADLRSADLRGADLSSAYLRDVDLINADLRDAYFRAYFIDAYLRGVRGSHLMNADLRVRGADLIGALYDDETKFPDGFEPDRLGMIKFEGE